LETVRLRYFNVFGPRQSPDSPYAAVIPLFLQALSNGGSPLIHGDGQQSRDFTFVADVVQANLRAATAAAVSGNVYNIACGRRTSLLELLGHLNRLLGTSIAPTHGPARAGDIRHSLADIEPARGELGYRPTIDIRTGLQRTVEWWKIRGHTPKRAALLAG
jgi:UDP-glucose 4-epimerase